MVLNSLDIMQWWNHFSHWTYNVDVNLCVINRQTASSEDIHHHDQYIMYQNASVQWAACWYQQRDEDKQVKVLTLTRGVSWFSCMAETNVPLFFNVQPHLQLSWSLLHHSPQLKHLGHQDIARRWGSSSSQSQTPLRIFTLHVGQPLNIV